jgi:hypothetical protein
MALAACSSTQLSLVVAGTTVAQDQGHMPASTGAALQAPVPVTATAL